MKCPNCFCAVADSVETCPCCGYILKKAVDDETQINLNPSDVATFNQDGNYATNVRFNISKKEIRLKADIDLKYNIIIVLLGIIILLNLFELIIK